MADLRISRTIHAKIPLLGTEMIVCDVPRSGVLVSNRGLTPLYVRTDGVLPSALGVNDGDFIVIAGTNRQFGFADPAHPTVGVAGVVDLAYSIEME